MSKPATIAIAVVGVLALAVVLGALALHTTQAPSVAAPDTVATDRLAMVPDAALAVRPPTSPKDASPKLAVHRRQPVGKEVVAYPTEATLMAKLHALKETDPPLTLQLARQGNLQHPDSPDAPERQWMVAKALTNLGRFDEARTEAEFAVKRYPGTSWTSDLQRHVLSNPQP
jgi:hypothetical protein